MFCRKCGNQIPDDSVFCPKCGAAVSENHAPPAETHEVDKNAFASSYEYKSSYNSTDDNKTSSYSSDREAPQSGENVITSPAVVAVKAKPKISKKALIIILSITGVLLVAGLIIFIAYVNRDQYPDFKYHRLENGFYVIDAYKGNELNVVIPDEMYGKPVVWINKSAFASSNIESVTIGSHISTIGDWAFASSTVKTVTFKQYISPLQNSESEEAGKPHTVHIGEFAFSGCENLSEFNFPSDEIADIGIYAFCDTYELKSITLPNVTTFGNCFDAFMGSGLETAVVGGELGEALFEECTNLKEVTIEAGTTDLPTLLFNNCTALEKVIWNCDIYTMHSISQDVFAGCTSLRQIVVAGETATYPRQISEIIKKYESIGAKQITFNDQAFKDCQYFKNPAKPAEPETPVEQPKPQVTAKTAVDIAKMTYSQIVEKYGMPEYYVGYNAYYDKYNLTVGFSSRTYSYNDGSKCFTKSNNSRVEYIILYGDKSTIIDSNMGNMHLGENLDYYSNYMSFDVYDALEMGAGDHGASWYELGYRHNNNGVTDYYATIEFTADDLYSYAVKVEYVGY